MASHASSRRSEQRTSKQLANVPPDKQQTQRIALVIQYRGVAFHGWQRQAKERTVQAEIEGAIAAILGYHTSLQGAGRTDAGVHAAAQVAHFTAPAVIPARALGHHSQ